MPTIACALDRHWPSEFREDWDVDLWEEWNGRYIYVVMSNIAMNSLSFTVYFPIQNGDFL